MKTAGCRFLAGICTLCFALIFCGCFPASAAETAGSLSVWCASGDEVLSGMHWKIYRVGHRAKEEYVFEGKFAEYRPTLGDTTKPMLEWDADTVAAAAETLRVYTIVDHIPCLAEGDTDAKGNLVFSGLEDGLYLVIGNRLEAGSRTYVPGAIFFEVDSSAENLLNAFPKIVYFTNSGEDEHYSVKKVWANTPEQEKNTAAYILCELYRDEELYETVRLDDSNGWLYQWIDQPGHEWLIVEKEIPEDYTVIYKGNHTQYIIINTYEPPYGGKLTSEEQTMPVVTTSEIMTTTAQTTDSGGSTQTTPQTTTGGSTQTGTQPTTPQSVTTTETAPPIIPPDDAKLPQTGQLWWPVPFLCGGGLILITTGIRLRKKDEAS